MPTLPVRPSFSQLQKQAKALRKDCQSGTEEALSRLRQHHPDYAHASAASCGRLSLRDAQFVVAREYGEDNWKVLKEKAVVEAEKSSREEIRTQRLAQQTSSSDEIERVIRAASGSGVRRSERITRGFSCEVHWITTEDGQELSSIAGSLALALRRKSARRRGSYSMRYCSCIESGTYGHSSPS